jgi:uncharacterized protein (DUF1330 family)
MKAYSIGNYDIIDEAIYMEYCKKVPATVAAFGGKTLVADHSPHNIEGKSSSFTVVVEFPDRKTALDWYGSTAYQEIVDLRKKSTRGWVQIVDEFSFSVNSV